MDEHTILPADQPEESILIERRGRDLLIKPPHSLSSLEDHLLQSEVFGVEQQAEVQPLLTRDRRLAAWRARPIDFAILTAALRRKAAYPIQVTFPETPMLPR